MSKNILYKGDFMSVRVYIGNLSFRTTEDTLKNAFAQYGSVLSCDIIKDKISQQSKGFGFVEMENEADAKTAISALNGKDLEGRRLRVNFAEDKAPRRDFRK